MTELKGFWKYVVETVKLTAAILLYTWLSPMWQPLVTGHPYIGGGLAGMTSAAAVIVVTYVIWPFSSVRLVVQRASTDAPFDGPSTDLVAASHDQYAALYRLRVHARSFGLLGWWAMRAAAKRGLEVTFRVVTPFIVLRSEAEDTPVESLDDGIVIPLPSRPSTTTWAYVKVSAGSKEMPPHADVDVVTELLYSGVKPWWAFGLRSSSNLKRIVLSRKEN